MSSNTVEVRLSAETVQQVALAEAAIRDLVSGKDKGYTLQESITDVLARNPGAEAVYKQFGLA
jgi:hypothetical protein